MKYLIFSDLHLHPWQYAATYTNGWNSRLLAQKNVLNQIIHSVRENGVKEIFFCGDFFHTHGKLDAYTLAVATDFFNEVNKKTEANITCLVGNHDRPDKGSHVHSLYWLRDLEHVTVVDHQWEIPGGLLISYTEDKEKLKKELAAAKKGSLVFMHQGVSGVKVNSDFVIPNEILTPDMIPSHVKHVFVGHYHSHKKVTDLITIVGSPMQHTWADSGEERGWLIYDDESNTFEREYSIAPRFIKLTEQTNVNVEGNYIKICYKVKDSHKEDLKQYYINLGALSVEYSIGSFEKWTAFNEAKDFNLNEAIDAFQKNKKLDDKAIEVGKQLRQGTYAVDIS